jgi:hypothetical protein
MKKAVFVLVAALMLTPAIAAAQDSQASGSGSGGGSAAGSGSGSGSGSGQNAKPAATAIRDDSMNPRFVRALTNVQIDVTLSDQLGTGAPVKKSVSMIVSSGNWGKVRSSGAVMVIGEAPYGVELNVDARPFVSVEGPIQVELTMQYAPVKGAGDAKVGPSQRPSGINQSQTVILQSGKPLVVAQAADPISDRKVVVELKATVLK